MQLRLSSPGLASAIMDYQLPICFITIKKIFHCLVWRWGKCLIYVQELKTKKYCYYSITYDKCSYDQFREIDFTERYLNSLRVLTSLSSAPIFKYFLTNSEIEAIVCSGLTAHFFLFMIGASPVALSSTSTTNNRRKEN